MVPAAAVAETFASLKAGLDVRAAGRVVAADSSAFSSGFAELDRALAGGFIRGSIATLEGSASSGRTSVLAGALAAATRALPIRATTGCKSLHMFSQTEELDRFAILYES